MGSNDARIIRGAAIPGWRTAQGAGSCRELTAICVLAFDEPLFPVPVQSERPCRDGDALIAVLDAAPGGVALRPSRGTLSNVLWHGQTYEPR
jgi:hypothetical protein